MWALTDYANHDLKTIIDESMHAQINLKHVSMQKYVDQCKPTNPKPGFSKNSLFKCYSE